ncbi:transcriptional regulator [Tyzzerella sp. An114]|mgnify:FL=1|uniref:metal-sensing transcriptional repressor n=1 Tax=Tyzzerella sp. An114 TaxID=1965545 RepID=UPI000B43D7EC|nr:metal-sensing transcriptional repressor [Tyzzerella sp. An114]OUQ57398.1 transcriptional regulator [Tyzzerella sp. An114]HIT72862.1 metal-sensing transcriptional repressor [Candidatus Fimicola cottocaccae]
MQADKNQIKRLLKTASGQLEGIMKMVDDDRYCIDISNQILATEAVLRRANKEILKAHMKSCVKNAIAEGGGDDKINEVIDILDKISK